MSIYSLFWVWIYLQSMALGQVSPIELASACFMKVFLTKIDFCIHILQITKVGRTIAHLADQKQSPFHFFPSSPFSNPALSTPPFWAPAGTVAEFTCGLWALERVHQSGQSEPQLKILKENIQALDFAICNPTCKRTELECLILVSHLII